MLYIIFYQQPGWMSKHNKTKTDDSKTHFKKWWKWNSSERRWWLDSGGAGMRWNNLFGISKNKWLHHHSLGSRYDASPRIHMQICILSLSVFVQSSLACMTALLPYERAFVLNANPKVMSFVSVSFASSHSSRPWKTNLLNQRITSFLSCLFLFSCLRILLSRPVPVTHAVFFVSPSETSTSLLNEHRAVPGIS